MPDIVSEAKDASFASPAEESLVRAWIEAYRAALGPLKEGAEARAVIKSCSAAHYEASGVAARLENMGGSLETLVAFLEREWGWKLSYDEAAGLIRADENKDYCVCPLARLGFVDSTELCACSEGFAETMFSAALRRPVKARVLRSILRDGSSCVYEIDLGTPSQRK